MGFNTPNGDDRAPNSQEVQRTSVVSLKDEKMKTPEGFLQVTLNIIEFIQKRFNEGNLHLVVFEVHGERIKVEQWMRHGFTQNNYDIPLLFLRISKKLNADERENLVEATKPHGKEKFARGPNGSVEALLSGIHFYLNNTTI